MVNRRTVDPSRSKDEALLIVGGLGTFLGAWFTVWVALKTSSQNPSPNPITMMLQLASGETSWTTSATIAAVAVVLIVGAVAAAGSFVFLKIRGPRVDVDASARHMASRRDVDPLTRKPTTKTARKLAMATDVIGMPLGYHLPSKARLWSSWEDMVLLIAGPRTMKSSSYIIPLALAAPGACFITENKRGVLDHTRGPRGDVGDVWVFDPQGVADEPASWWWNPLSYVVDETTAEKMAAQIAESTREPGRGDAYFDNEAVNLLHLLLLAAASAHEPITIVYSWLTDASSTRPVGVLTDHGYEAQAESLDALRTLSDRQRDGVYGSARALVGFLRNRQMMAWVTPGAARPEFDPQAFVQSTDTLYALSNDGKTSAGPLVGALTLAVFEAAEKHATSCPGGRLPTPMVGLLDEAANVCRFKDLDAKYSHYGSRGIIMMTVLQSWDQGEEIWGKHGMEKLWSAANVKIYGGGVSDTRFLQRVSDLIGPYEHLTGSSSTSRSGRSRSRSVVERPIMSVAELGALPRRRAVAIASGVRPALVKVVPWFEHDKTTRDRVNLSLTTSAPAEQHHLEASTVAPTVVDEQNPWQVKRMGK